MISDLPNGPQSLFFFDSEVDAYFGDVQCELDTLIRSATDILTTPRVNILTLEEIINRRIKDAMSYRQKEIFGNKGYCQFNSSRNADIGRLSFNGDSFPFYLDATNHAIHLWILGNKMCEPDIHHVTYPGLYRSIFIHRPVEIPHSVSYEMAHVVTRIINIMHHERTTRIKSGLEDISIGEEHFSNIMLDIFGTKDVSSQIHFGVTDERGWQAFYTLDPSLVDSILDRAHKDTGSIYNAYEMISSLMSDAVEFDKSNAKTHGHCMSFQDDKKLWEFNDFNLQEDSLYPQHKAKFLDSQRIAMFGSRAVTVMPILSEPHERGAKLVAFFPTELSGLVKEHIVRRDRIRKRIIHSYHNNRNYFQSFNSMIENSKAHRTQVKTLKHIKVMAELCEELFRRCYELANVSKEVLDHEIDSEGKLIVYIKTTRNILQDVLRHKAIRCGEDDLFAFQDEQFRELMHGYGQEQLIHKFKINLRPGRPPKSNQEILHVLYPEIFNKGT